MAERHNVWKPETSRFYYCRFTVGGQQFRGSTKMTARSDAVAYAKEWKRAEIRKFEEAGGMAKPAAIRNMTLLQGADRYAKECKCTPHNAPALERRLDWLIEQAGASTRLADIDDDVVSRLCGIRGDMSRNGNPKLGKVSDATVNSDVVDLLSAILWRAKRKWKVPLVMMPDFSEHRLTLLPRTRELSIPEEISLQAVAGDYWDILEFALLSGLRREELRIRWHDVAWDVDRIRLRVKGGKMHEVLITPGIRRILEANRGRHEEFVFTTRQAHYCTGRDLPPRPVDEIGHPISYRNLYSQFRLIRKAAGIKDLTIHDLRRTAGARKYRLTGDIGLVSTFLGHASIEMTRKHYVHIKLDDVMVRILAAEAAQELKKQEIMALLAV
ncbi:tyrosine-type recombinase/integrase [Methylobacterium radiotolerans]|uniref:tyrosine-type recombinase/integrase n=1 Tax=Methylobacterium radiotolerans TaxID=31998 RepID=UPI001F3EA657|nr:tyrosine-type recombinase/integrase [Methylobacterium radiotolerans]UIY44214.1 tyrosine-type recombinase/integrase [Methylobacterium radiotolerans]